MEYVPFLSLLYLYYITIWKDTMVLLVISSLILFKDY